MSDAKKTIYLLYRELENGDMQLALARSADEAKRRMIDEGYRVFELRHEQSLEDLSA